MDLFDRSFDPQAPITSGARHLSTAAARFAVSMVRSLPLLPEALFSTAKRLLTVEALWSLCLVLAGWVIATVVGGLLGLAVNALLIAYGVLELWEQLKSTAAEVRTWALSAYQAQRDAELDVAAQHFAQALSQGGLAVLELVLTHRVFRAVEGTLRDRFPPPDWLRPQYEQALKQRTEAASQRAWPRPPERVRGTAEKWIEGTASGVRSAGAQRIADGVPGGAAVCAGAMCAVGAVVLVAWAARARSPRRAL